MLSLELMPTTCERSLCYQLTLIWSQFKCGLQRLARSLALSVAMMRYSRTWKRSDLVEGGVRALSLLPTEGNPVILIGSWLVTTKSSKSPYEPSRGPIQLYCMSSCHCWVLFHQVLRCQRDKATQPWPFSLQRYKLSKHLFFVRYPWIFCFSYRTKEKKTILEPSPLRNESVGNPTRQAT